MQINAKKGKSCSSLSRQEEGSELTNQTEE